MECKGGWLRWESLHVVPTAGVLALALMPCGWGQVRAKAGGTQSIRAAEQAFKRGSTAYERGDLEGARVAFATAVRLAPQVAAGHSALGAVLLAEAKALAAAKELEIARKLNPQDRLTILHLAIAYADSGEYPRAVEAYRALQTLPVESTGGEDGMPMDAAIRIANALSQTGQLPEAEAVLRRASAGAPGSAAGHDALGSVLAQEKRYPEAVPEFERAIALEGKAETYYHLGSANLQTGQLTEAVSDLERAHALVPNNVAYAMQLAEGLAKAGDDEKAIGLLRMLLAGQLGPAETVQVKYLLALALQGTGKAEEALALFGEVVKARPQDAAALTNAGLAHVQLGDAKGGVALYLRALALSPRDATLDEDLGVAYLQQNDLVHALEYFRAGLGLDPESPQLHYDLGLALKLKDDLGGAIPEFERAAALDPSLPDPPYTLGVIYMQQGRFAEAARSLERVTELRPDNGDAWATLGSVYKQLETPDKAVTALRRAIALLPLQPSPHITLAAVLAGQGMKEEAAQERKTGADLTRLAMNRQKADFGIQSGLALMKRGQMAEAIVQLRSAMEAAPEDAAIHAALGEALMRSGNEVEGKAEQLRAEALRGKRGVP